MVRSRILLLRTYSSESSSAAKKMNITNHKRYLSVISILIVVLYLFSNIFPYDLITPLLHEERSDQSIPRNIIQTHKSSSDFIHRTLTFKNLNRNHSYFFFDDSEAERFVQRNMPKNIWLSYQQMPKAILKADFFRYIAVYVLGGFYSDMDTSCLRPIDTWTDHYNPDHVGFMVGIEAESPNWQRDYARPLQLCQWTFGARTHHPILKRLIDRIVNVSSSMQRTPMNYATIINWTGPGMWTDTIFDYLNEPYNVQWTSLKRLNQSRLIGDVLVLPITAFQPYGYDMGAKGPSHPDARINHHFAGTWKKEFVN